MLPEKLEFLKQFLIFYKGLVRDIKEEKINEADFYMIIKAKCKAEERKNRERIEINVELPDKTSKYKG